MDLQFGQINKKSNDIYKFELNEEFPKSSCPKITEKMLVL